MNEFVQKLRFGRAGEQVVTLWLQQRGFLVTATSKWEACDGAPSVTGERLERVILPDLVALGEGQVWVEVKTKRLDVRFNKCSEWRQGIDQDHFHAYMRIQERSRCPGFLAFLVLNPLNQKASDTPHRPATLRVGALSLLDQYKHPAVYPDGSRMFLWNIEMLECHEVQDTRIVTLRSAADLPRVTYVWDRPAPTQTTQQCFFDFDQTAGCLMNIHDYQRFVNKVAKGEVAMTDAQLANERIVADVAKKREQLKQDQRAVGAFRR